MRPERASVIHRGAGVVLALAALLAAVSCSGHAGDGSLSEWQGDRATLTVPLDHDDPDGPTIDVPVYRREAGDPERRIGVLLVNPGGPGLRAAPLVQRDSYTDELVARFDIVALDPRGSFPETEVDCTSDRADFETSYDWTPDEPGELEATNTAIQAVVDGCAAEYGDLLPHVSTMDTVHDLAALVYALGEDEVSYFGFSYGSALGAAFVTEYPELVRAAVFDGAERPYGDPLQGQIAGQQGVEAMLVSILDECDASSDCPIQGGAQAAFERVAAAADAMPFAADPGLPAVNQQAFNTVVTSGDHAYGGSPRPLLSAVAAADQGDPVPLQQLYDSVVARQAEGVSLLAIRCVDWPYRGESPLPENALQTLTETAPIYNSIFRFSPDSIRIPGFCERWPADPDPIPTPLSGAGAGPVLVVTATGDAVTSIFEARQLSEELVNDTLLIVEDNQHVSYNRVRGSSARTCATELIDAFLIDLTLPPDGTICKS